MAYERNLGNMTTEEAIAYQGATSQSSYETGQAESLSDEKLYQIYVCGDSEEEHDGIDWMVRQIKRNGISFSFTTALLGCIYYAYRRLLPEAIIYGSLAFLVAFLFGPIFLIPLQLIGCFAFYPLYGKKVRSAVEWVKKEGKSKQAVEMLRENGGSRGHWAVLAVVMLGCLVALAYAYHEPNWGVLYLQNWGMW